MCDIANFFFLKGLNRGVPFKCLPLDFMGFYAIVGMEMDKTIKDVTKRYMVNDVLARKDAIKTMTYSSSKMQWGAWRKNGFLDKLNNVFLHFLPNSEKSSNIPQKMKKNLVRLAFKNPFFGRSVH